MDELTLGLIGAGAVVVGGVVVYNAWQGAKVRRRMPRPMPEETAEAISRPERDDELPFIEPVRQPVRREPAAAAPVAAGGASAEATRVEPTFGGVSAGAAPADTPADLQAEATGAETRVDTAARDEASEPADASADAHAAPAAPAATAESAERAEPVLPAATTISSAPPAVVDRRIDCIVPIRLGAPLPGDKILPAAQRLRRAGSKPVHIEGKPEGGHWELLQNGVRYEELRAAAQLANRSGALNELEFSEFVTGVQQFADAIDGAPEFPDMMETVAMARELDGFAAQCDAQLSINVLSDGAPWSANYVQAVASQDGLLLSRDGTRFVKLDAKQNPVFMLQFGDTNFLRDDLTYKGGDMITLVLDVPVAEEDILPFRLMCDYAKSLSERIGARVVDDSRRPLPESTLLAIEQQLMKLYAKLEEAGIPAGSPVTRRLFSQ
ncbi:cell division protein ZipA C-terminal FtsZ-binding domain-containing protein [Burkholderia multivorans]|uniref:cell division protein ZipA C-terminal FtsZ-binding domain-containing protein n=1 Tax=Burkholderia multivorans TaxID=87883 RepID=UPI000D3BCC7E|nr:cell division protein ZipA C-terminal FtsZ-binding domain-containing protein [Burkholderia multivorans]MBR8018340.1 cell division protein FtsZ [Burkholderia multivorans]MEB2510844.1 cell division protein ZipA C-terminal FtsZ-binding domain-containing protein [Burkholderia multivorans]MEB2522602.1 cell division protein ZipA C-terminal FtsZ-binding domain-containing protein [Burkholderia multivorans]MEB2573133.1 cell division protein ZipA C-terminal FtsZ-binding domain-containing protein [Burk